MIKTRCSGNLDQYLFIDFKVSITEYILRLGNIYCYKSFLPRPFWQKRGLILLLNHPKVTFTQLPDEPPSDSNGVLTQSELLECLNPVAICNVLEQENKEWLQFFVKEHFDKKIALGVNPMQDEESLGKLISYKLAVFNHSGSNDMQARYILPVKTLLSNLLKFPDKLERVRVQFVKTQREFFESFEVFELLCYLEQFDTIAVVESVFSRKRKNFYDTLYQLKAFSLNNFDQKEITFNLEILSQLTPQYLAIKNE